MYAEKELVMSKSRSVFFVTGRTGAEVVCDHQWTHSVTQKLNAQALALLGRAHMGSRRTFEDPAARTAAAEVDRMRPADAAAAATEQPSSSQEQFVNTGLQTWLERRRQWTQKPPDFKRTARKRAHSPSVTPEQVLSFTPFPKPVGLQEVIAVLQEVWEQDDYF